MKPILLSIVLVLGVLPANANVFFQTNNVAVAQGVKTFRLPVEAMRGWTVRGSAMVKAENVTAKPNPWNGIKVMLIIETPDGKSYPQAPLDVGTFDWKRAVFTARIPTNATAVTLCLGLEKVTGKVWFDAVKISGHKPPTTTKPAPVPGPMFTGRTVPRLRGAMIGPRIDEEGLRAFGRDWNANLVRWQLIRNRRTSTTGDYDQWLEGELQRLDAGLPLCEKYGLMVAIDLHSPPGGKPTRSGYYGSDDRLFTDRKMQDKFVEVWRHIATRYKNSKAVWGYDLANEPVEEFVEDGCDDWHALATRAAKAIRAIDPARAIICEAPPWGGPDSLKEFTPIAVSNVVYSVHMYVPGEFTHQGVHNNHVGVPYPGEIKGKMWDKAALEKVLQPVLDFQKNYNVHIYIGEFSAIRWAPGDSAYRYLRDCIDIFESHGWDWSYHAFREWDGWSVEHGPDRNDRQPAKTPTDRERLLRSWFARNQKP
ncbi:MAG: glycoside hydrolase family 5 protein [Verrucomicrobia bacterium]|nr:glycoside hydrolase family 5 protein [Verrucomicrobiota bacterium]